MKKKEIKIVNPLKGISGYSWFFEQNVYFPDSIIRALKSEEGSGNIPKVIIRNEISK